jgi:hypothetical protein
MLCESLKSKHLRLYMVLPDISDSIPRFGFGLGTFCTRKNTIRVLGNLKAWKICSLCARKCSNTLALFCAAVFSGRCYHCKIFLSKTYYREYCIIYI